MTLLFVYLFLAVFVSFMCSLLEAVILSVTPVFINTEINNGKKYAKILKKLKEEIDRPLSAILTLNTIAHTVGAAGVGSEVNKIFGDQFLALASGLLTFVILIFSEIIPKTLGAGNWKTFAPPTAYCIRFMILVLYPIVALTEVISDLVGGVKKNNLTREEMIATAEIGVGHGALKKKESNIIKNLLMLNNIYVSDIMTPRSVGHGPSIQHDRGRDYRNPQTHSLLQAPRLQWRHGPCGGSGPPVPDPRSFKQRPESANTE